MPALRDDAAVVARILDHIDRSTTDLAEGVWREPVAAYRSDERFRAERELVLRRSATPFCPSAALPERGSHLARDAAGTPILAVRGDDGRVRAFRNACRHRGAQIAEGAGCEKAFVCRYHGWAYGRDGALLRVPHEHGFPGLDRSARGLVPLPCAERNGLVIVSPSGDAIPEEALDALPPGVIPASHRLVTATESETPANWKIVVEGFLEGYHIRPTHRDTFYPLQFDNLNVVETFGPNSRIAFPYRAIHKLRSVPHAERSADGVLTYVYHLFPNVMVATFPTNRVVVAIEPLAIDRTRLVTYTLAAPGGGASNGANNGASDAALRAALEFVRTGAAEDTAVAVAVQRGLESGANEALEFGRFEGALAHFHRMLHERVDGALQGRTA